MSLSTLPAVYLNKIRTAVPPYEVHSKFIHYLKTHFPLDEKLQKLAALCERTQIEKRYSVIRPFFDAQAQSVKDLYSETGTPTTEQRMQRYRQEALPLALEAARPLLSSVPTKKITHVIVVSCTGFYAPGLDIELIGSLGLNSSVERFLIGFMGCYAAVPALKLAAHLVRSEPQARVLMVNLELCTLHWRPSAPFDQQVSFALFADGCAASLISREPVGLKLDRFYNTLIPETTDLMGWTIGNEGFFMNLDAAIPMRLQETLISCRQDLLSGKDPHDFSLWAVHPGGKSILDAAQNALGLSDRAMAASRSILKDYGNMSSATLMFVLKLMMEDPNLQGEGCAMAFGPGLTLESFLFQKERA